LARGNRAKKNNQEAGSNPLLKGEKCPGLGQEKASGLTRNKIVEAGAVTFGKAQGGTKRAGTKKR